jgi:tungstate transport system substrate-binding protein
MRAKVLVLAALAVALPACSSTTRVVVAAGTTIVDSGWLDVVAERYEKEHPGIDLSIVADATAPVLELGRRGAADVLITHAPEAEAAFLAQNETTRYLEVFVSRFVLVGPPSATGGLTTGGIVEAMRSIASGRRTFVTRADGSGTHAAERALWIEAGVDPSEQDWYVETGQGMGFTLQVADQRAAFTLSELGAFRTAAGTLSLVSIVDDPTDPRLQNPYHATVPAAGSARVEAERFVDWLVSEAGRAAIRDVNRALYGGEEVYRLPDGR